MLTLVLSTRLLSFTLYGKAEALPVEGGRVRSGCGRALREKVRSVPLPKAWIAFPEEEEEGKERVMKEPFLEGPPQPSGKPDPVLFLPPLAPLANALKPTPGPGPASSDRPSTLRWALGNRAWCLPEASRAVLPGQLICQVPPPQKKRSPGAAGNKLGTHNSRNWCHPQDHNAPRLLWLVSSC